MRTESIELQTGGIVCSINRVLPEATFIYLHPSPLSSWIESRVLIGLEVPDSVVGDLVDITRTVNGRMARRVHHTLESANATFESEMSMSHWKTIIQRVRETIPEPLL